MIRRHAELEAENRELRLKVERLTRLVYVDSLTGLANRRYLETALDAEIRRAYRQQNSLTLVLFDIDHFKHINDTFGHQYGDLVLAGVAHAVRPHCRRAGDVAARYGGDEFALLFPAVSSREAVQVVERLRRSIAALRLRQARAAAPAAVTISIGATTLYAAQPCLAADVVHAADAALYEAKRNGRNRAKYRSIDALGRNDRLLPGAQGDLTRKSGPERPVDHGLEKTREGGVFAKLEFLSPCGDK